jgi:hypothetical protein
MAKHVNRCAMAPGLATPERPEKDETRELGGGAGFGDWTRNDGDCRVGPTAGQALRAIEGERKASEYLTRLRAEQADPDELALIVSMLYGATLRGFCRAIVKALGVSHA